LTQGQGHLYNQQRWLLALARRRRLAGQLPIIEPRKKYSMQLLLLYLTLALVISFLCSIAEAVLMSMTPAYIANLKRQNSALGECLGRLKSNIDRPLAAILSLNTIANTAGAAAIGAQATVVFGSRSVGIVSALLTLLILIFAEIIPKTIGSVYWRKLAPLVGRSVQKLTWLLWPLVYLSELLTRLLTRGHNSHSFNRDELAAMAQLGAQRGQLSAQEYRILANLLHFRAFRITNVMTPRTVVMALPEDKCIGQIGISARELPFSRIPIYSSEMDDCSGFVLKIDVMLHKAQGHNDLPLKALRRPLSVLPEQSSLFHAFEFLLQHREHIALVVDEYGGMEGIVTLEDVVETLLGLEIVDEADVNVDMRELARSRWRRHAEQLGLDSESPDAD